MGSPSRTQRTSWRVTLARRRTHRRPAARNANASRNAGARRHTQRRTARGALRADGLRALAHSCWTSGLNFPRRGGQRAPARPHTRYGPCDGAAPRSTGLMCRATLCGACGTRGTTCDFSTQHAETRRRWARGPHRPSMTRRVLKTSDALLVLTPSAVSINASCTGTARARNALSC
jgi:hypothetical protein